MAPPTTRPIARVRKTTGTTLEITVRGFPARTDRIPIVRPPESTIETPYDCVRALATRMNAEVPLTWILRDILEAFVDCEQVRVDLLQANGKLRYEAGVSKRAAGGYETQSFGQALTEKMPREGPLSPRTVVSDLKVLYAGAKNTARYSIIPGDTAAELLQDRLDASGMDSILLPLYYARDEEIIRLGLLKIQGMNLALKGDVTGSIGNGIDQRVSLALTAGRMLSFKLYAHIDAATTGLPRKEEFNQRLEELTRAYRTQRAAAANFSVIMADIDHFKQLNDQHGHFQGDVVLAEIAKRLATGVQSRGKVYRWGGEEFAIVLPGIGLDEAMPIAEQLRAGIEREPIGLGAAQETVTCSFGVTDIAHGTSVKIAADKALYYAKRQGRNRVASSVEVPLEMELRG